MTGSERGLVPDSTTVIALSSQYPAGLIGVPLDTVRLSWQVRAQMPAARQLAYEIQVAGDPQFGYLLGSSGIVADSACLDVVAPGAALTSRECRFYRMRIQTQTGWTAWSPTAVVEAGLGSPSDWAAVAIGADSPPAGPSPLLRTEFALPAPPRRARLYVTSLGVHELHLNGRRVGEDHLAPGWTTYHHRLLVSTFDVAQQLVRGKNALGASLADGWYRGRLGWEGRDPIYGEELAVLAQLEVECDDGSLHIVTSNTSWRTSFGAVRAAGIYDGTDIDFTLEPRGWGTPGFDDTGWAPAHEVPIDTSLLDLPIALPVRQVGSFAMRAESAGDRLRLDAGQNIAGWVRLVVSGKAGDTVAVRHAEVLNSDGSLHTASLRSARATDTYVLAGDGEVTLEPHFTYHGFRYADVVTTATFLSATAVAISSALESRGTFECSHEALNRLHANVRWSQIDNFVSVPTDCPQRDERLGWTGDAQVFAPTANTLFQTAPFWRSWLRDLALDQAADGAVPAVVPNILSSQAFKIADEVQDIMGRAAWADAATIVPWSLYEYFGDTRTLCRQLPSMRQWVDHLDSRREGQGLLPSEFQFGDWLDPDAPSAEPWAAKVSSDFVANAFFSHSARLVSWAEQLVGHPDRAPRYERLADEIAVLTWTRHGTAAAKTQTGCAVALEFSIAPADQRAAVALGLADLVRAEHGRIATGFVGTPLILHALSRSGHIDEAYRMLLRTGPPSWLYQVHMGATTVWERWDALLPDGSIHPGDMANEEGGNMLSFNHYAYGAVIDWVYRNVAGLAPTLEGPGYRVVEVAPRPATDITWARAALDTSFGTLAIDWAVTDDVLRIELNVPFGTTAKVRLPSTGRSIVTADGLPASADLQVGHGAHYLTMTAPSIAGRCRSVR